MSSQLSRIAVHGAAGRMGRQLLTAIAERDGVTLGAAIDRAGQACIGLDTSVLGGGQETGIRVHDDAAACLDDFDVIVDFSSPAASLALLDTLDPARHAVVIGTTGIDAAGFQRIQARAHEMPVVFAPNYSIGVTLSLALLDAAARALGDDYDVEIIEAHHRHKVDAPSGTALRMGEVLADALGRNLEADAVYGREGITGERERRTIGFATVRAGDIIGEHTVLFGGNGERIEITHRATDRMTFARGAIRAAHWLATQRAGLYDMTHVLGLAQENKA